MNRLTLYTAYLTDINSEKGYIHTALHFYSDFLDTSLTLALEANVSNNKSEVI